jgi:adenosylmethionine-8-amino-7-oxononanoate aminotransferase
MPELRSFYNSLDLKKIIKTDKWHIHFADGTKELDLLSGGLSFIFGQNNREIVEGLEEYILTVARCQSNKGHFTEDLESAGNILMQGVWHSYSWGLSGTSAVESAISMSDEYWDQLGECKPDIISFPFTWHGSSYLTKSLGTPELVPAKSNRIIHVEDVSTLEEYITPKVGCIIFESSTFIKGLYPHKKDWIQTLRDICDRNNILLISDDVASCWGKTKAYHPYQTIGYGIQPDISALGKSLAGGYVPMAAAVCNEKVGKVISKPGVWKYPGTWQPSMAGIYLMIKTYNYMEKYGLIGNSYNIEERLKNIGMELLEKGKITDYRVSGGFFAFDMNHINNAGYSSTKNPYVVKGCAPLIADDFYFEELKETIGS